MQNKVLDINAVSKLPTLLMSETQGDGNQVAHVGTITQLKLSGADFRYALGAYFAQWWNWSTHKLTDSFNDPDVLRNVGTYQYLPMKCNISQSP
jgi:hypothetical protein